MRRAINAKVSDITGDRVATGLFSGMKIPLSSPWEDGNLGTKLVGSYEHELHRAFEAVLRREPQTIINAGCAEGFYAVGLARLAPKASVVAYDINATSLALCKRMAIENGVGDRVFPKLGCTSPFQLEIGRERRLVMMDVEGHEKDLLDPDSCPALRRADIIVECHDYLREGVSSSIIERFERSHKVGTIEPKPPVVGAYPFLASLPFGVLLEAITEKRPPGTVWLICLAA